MKPQPSLLKNVLLLLILLVIAFGIYLFYSNNPSPEEGANTQSQSEYKDYYICIGETGDDALCRQSHDAPPTAKPQSGIATPTADPQATNPLPSASPLSY